MKRRISDLLLAIGIPPQLKGYRLLSCAAELRLEEEVPFGRSAKALYAQLAERFGSDPQKVERAIHHAIELAWARDGGKSLSRAMGFPLYAPHNKPGNSEFIALLADKLRLERQG
ncbi:MAG: sporulation initiation factor Spo0A C-terminal domain-containing protein [Christensenellaceae bacterium]|nr:sporulation initiation factor Spo0A C-terminal domain-containing protein [Christensenellaceae bacterium]